MEACLVCMSIFEELATTKIDYLKKKWATATLKTGQQRN